MAVCQVVANHLVLDSDYLGAQRAPSLVAQLVQAAACLESLDAKRSVLVEDPVTDYLAVGSEVVCTVDQPGKDGGIQSLG